MINAVTERSISLNRLTFGYPGKDFIFKEVSLELNCRHREKGHIVALMGASGVGKSSLLNLILGIERPLSGSVDVKPSSAIISFLPQEPVLFNHLTPLQNSAYFSTTTAFRKRFDPQFFQKMSAELDMDRLLQQTRSVSELSGGEKQRLMLLRALSIRPDILLLDEPTNGLDAETKLRFLTLLREIVVQNQMLTIYCTHNKIESDLIADDILYLSSLPVKGQKVFHASFEDFTSIPPTVEAYKAFNYPVANVLSFRLDKEGYAIPTDETAPEVFYIALTQQCLNFVKTGTIDYTVLGFNSAYTQLNIEGQSVNLPTSQVISETGNRLSLNGDLLTYHPDESFAGVKKFVNSKDSNTHV